MIVARLFGLNEKKGEICTPLPIMFMYIMATIRIRILHV